MTYFTAVERYGRKETKIDLARFAADLARELGVGAPTKPANDLDGYRWYLPIGGDTLLWLTANEWKKRVTVHVEAVGVAHDERNYYAADHKTKDITVDPDRAIAAIARDIKRRAIDAAAPALAARRKYAAELRAARNGFKTAVADLKTALPGLDIRHLNEKDRRADIYGAGGLAAELHYDETITIKRLTLTPATFTKVMELINAPDAAG